jgi:acyl dehydratase
MTTVTEFPLLSVGRTWQQMPVGLAFRTSARTLTEADLVNFIGLSGYTEPLFLDASHAAEGGYTGRLIPGALTFSVAEGLVLQTNVLHGTGLAFMHTDLKVVSPVYVGDTIHVTVQITESRQSRRPGRGIVVSRNAVVNSHGEEVLIYNPVRMIRGDDFDPADGELRS